MRIAGVGSIANGIARLRVNKQRDVDLRSKGTVFSFSKRGEIDVLGSRRYFGAVNQG